jgi:Rv2525c-like, glycoside hydrolase-like domain
VRIPKWLALCAIVLGAGFPTPAFPQSQSYLGFDRNDYPGDENLAALHRTFAFAGYWLNNPPGAASNTWIGKRRVVQAAGFGFLLLFNGRPYAELKHANPKKLGKLDGQAAVLAAWREGFPPGAVIFLDQEEGGRMLPEQKSYIYAWADEVARGAFRPGIYCSGIAFEESPGVKVVTAEDIHQHQGDRNLVYFVTNDSCPPSPGCAFPRQPPGPAESGISFAEAWQFAQSPKRKDVAGGCPANYNPDGQCYAPGVNPALHLHVDVESAASADPSQGRTR